MLCAVCNQEIVSKERFPFVSLINDEQKRVLYFHNGCDQREAVIKALRDIGLDFVDDGKMSLHEILSQLK